ncbi:MAG: hypothetical protein E7556_05255 [Ruminococcaceae bacterium]|nr:hypothetical protein [Oscillospiraceae bacterium]
MVNKKILAIFLICVIVFCCFSITCTAKTSNGVNNNVNIVKESILPKNLKFSVQDNCSRHSIFQQVAACENGSFAIYTYGTMTDGVLSETNKKFIDIYDSNADFFKEITFETSSDVVIELTESTVNIYLYSEIICYDYKKQETKYFSTADYEAYNSGFVDSLRKNEFSKGDWEYNCKKSFLGYTKLSRTNGLDTQILFDATTDNTINANGIIPVISSVILLMIGLKVWLSKRGSQGQS